MSNSEYPTLKQVEQADREQLCRWHRFLPSPGGEAIDKGSVVFYAVLEKQGRIMDYIEERLSEVGGMSTEISKKIGWDKS